MLVNSNISQTGLVEKYIGTAYDQMSELHRNLEDLLTIAASIDDGSFDEVAKIADEIQTLISKIDEFNSTYYGTFPEHPEVDPNGNAMTAGDLYYNSTRRLMYVYVDFIWTPLGAVNLKVIRIIVGGEHFQGSGIYVVDLGHDPLFVPYTYLPGYNNMTVHRNGALIVGKHISADGTYTELNTTEVRFHNEDLENPVIITGDVLVFTIGTEAATVTHIGEVDVWVYETEWPDQTVIELPDHLSYIMGTNNLTVHIKQDKGSAYERSLQLPNIPDINYTGDYIETDPTRITFNAGLALNTEVTMTIGHVVANDDSHYQVIMSTETPDPFAFKEGQLWFREDTGRMYILYFDDIPLLEDDDISTPWKNRQWISTTPEDTVIGDDGVYSPDPDPPTVIHGTIFQDQAPEAKDHSEGTLWFNVQTGNLHIKYQDRNSHQWVKVSN